MTSSLIVSIFRMPYGKSSVTYESKVLIYLLPFFEPDTSLEFPPAMRAWIKRPICLLMCPWNINHSLSIYVHKKKKKNSKWLKSWRTKLKSTHKVLLTNWPVSGFTFSSLTVPPLTKAFNPGASSPWNDSRNSAYRRAVSSSALCIT